MRPPDRGTDGSRRRQHDGAASRPHGLRWPSIIAPKPGDPLPALWQRLAWMAGIWAASVAALLLLGLLLRLVLKA